MLPRDIDAGWIGSIDGRINWQTKEGALPVTRIRYRLPGGTIVKTDKLDRIIERDRRLAECEYARQIMVQDSRISRDEALRIAAEWVRTDRGEPRWWSA